MLAGLCISRVKERGVGDNLSPKVLESLKCEEDIYFFYYIKVVCLFFSRSGFKILHMLSSA